MHRTSSECDSGSFEALKTDHAVSLSAPASATVGSSVAITLTARNLGPRKATGVSISDAFAVGLTFASSADCSSGPTVQCGVGDLEAGASATRTVNLSPTQAGAQAVAATLVTDLAEAAPGDE